MLSIISSVEAILGLYLTATTILVLPSVRTSLETKWSALVNPIQKKRFCSSESSGWSQCRNIRRPSIEHGDPTKSTEDYVKRGILRTAFGVPTAGDVLPTFRTNRRWRFDSGPIPVLPRMNTNPICHDFSHCGVLHPHRRLVISARAVISKSASNLTSVTGATRCRVYFCAEALARIKWEES